MAVDYSQWLQQRAAQLQAAGGNVNALMPQQTTTPDQVAPGFGIAGQMQQPPPQMYWDETTGQWMPRTAPPPGTPLAGPQLANVQQQPRLPMPPPPQLGGQSPGSPTGFGLPPQGWSASPAANQQFGQYGPMGAAAGQQGGQFGYLSQTNGQRPAGTAAGPWSSSPVASAPSVPRIAAARTTQQVQQQQQPASGARIQGQGVQAAQPTRNVNTATSATPGGINLGPTGVGTAPQTLQAYGAALPTPNKIVARNFTRLDPDTQDFLRSGYRAQGYSDNQVNQAVKQGLPQFKVPGTSGTFRG
jgi:hypothetical protein